VRGSQFLQLRDEEQVSLGPRAVEEDDLTPVRRGG
jgi:hypothetical protein